MYFLTLAVVLLTCTVFHSTGCMAPSSHSDLSVSDTSRQGRQTGNQKLEEAAHCQSECRHPSDLSLHDFRYGSRDEDCLGVNDSQLHGFYDYRFEKFVIATPWGNDVYDYRFEETIIRTPWESDLYDYRFE